MKAILILALTIAALAPAAEPSTVTFDGKTQQVLIVEQSADGILVATSTGTRKLKVGEYAVHAPSAPVTVASPNYAAVAQELAARERARRDAERVAAERRAAAEEIRAICEEMRDIRTWLILEEARKRGINIAIYE